MENKPNSLIFHHTADSSGYSQLDKVNAFHHTKFQWPSSLGYFVAYHYFIDKDGRTTQCRAENECGPDELGHNCDGVSVCLAGNFSAETPNAAQIASFQTLALEIMARNKLTLADIKPHRAYSQTTCPGALLPDAWGAATVASAQLYAIKLLFLKIKIALGL